VLGRGAEVEGEREGEGEREKVRERGGCMSLALSLDAARDRGSTSRMWQYLCRKLIPSKVRIREEWRNFSIVDWLNFLT
jgi:hypothetical protein